MRLWRRCKIGHSHFRNLRSKNKLGMRDSLSRKLRSWIFLNWNMWLHMVLNSVLRFNGLKIGKSVRVFFNELLLFEVPKCWIQLTLAGGLLQDHFVFSCHIRTLISIIKWNWDTNEKYAVDSATLFHAKSILSPMFFKETNRPRGS